tara:strand:- start:68 stop:262 length:195 start_codon:yes stop_codon:yes gene_type:complete
MFEKQALVSFTPPDPGGAAPRPPHGKPWRYVANVTGKAQGVSVHPSAAHVAIVQQVWVSKSGEQ